METREELMKKSFFYLANKSLEELVPRSREIVKKRFGLLNGKPSTLDSIGKEYGITRERVRQIIADSLKKVFGKSGLPLEVITAKNKIVLEIESRNGIINQNWFLDNLKDNTPKEKNSALFFADCSNDIQIVEIKGIIEKSWLISRSILDKVEKVDEVAKKLLKEKKSPTSVAFLIKEISAKLPELDKKTIEFFLETLSEVCSNKFGKWGLCSWPEIKPKNTKDKIYLVLKETKKPLHFSRIANLIDEYGLSSRKSHPQTVHNELIKDDRFVLIGRGIYALSEWGYNKGTVREVLRDILKENGPLSKEDIFEKIFKTRKVKKATVMINLNNDRFFVKKKDLFEVKK